MEQSKALINVTLLHHVKANYGYAETSAYFWGSSNVFLLKPLYFGSVSKCLNILSGVCHVIWVIPSGEHNSLCTGLDQRLAFFYQARPFFFDWTWSLGETHMELRGRKVDTRLASQISWMNTSDQWDDGFHCQIDLMSEHFLICFVNKLQIGVIWARGYLPHGPVQINVLGCNRYFPIQTSEFSTFFVFLRWKNNKDYLLG